MPASKGSAEGVASKDVEKIQKLREFMSKQTPTHGAEKSSPNRQYRASGGSGKGGNMNIVWAGRLEFNFPKHSVELIRPKTSFT